MDKVAFVNERQDKRMEGIEEGALSLVSRVAVTNSVSYLKDITHLPRNL